ncbi:MAG: ElyC/SanA/YdcF family protein [Opitutaceae bacterium]|jgi:uncharacterized SAM-binding protein YcdF (DUF218 family)
MLFWLKKSIAYWLMPFPVCLVLIVAAWLLLRSEKRARVGRRLLAAAAAILLLLGNATVSTWLVRPLETVYPAIPEIGSADPVPPELEACKFVVVLGGGFGDTAGLSATNQLSASALARIVEAVRLLRVLPGAGLIVSGPAEEARPSLASVLAQAAVSLGIERDRIILIDTARDTEDESNAVKAIAGESRVALVTSAWHMPRAAALFREARVEALPCPADFSARPNPEFSLRDLGWDVESLERSTYAIHERLGILWLLIRGKG